MPRSPSPCRCPGSRGAPIAIDRNACVELILDALPDLPPGARWLLVEPFAAELRAAIQTRGGTVASWRRLADEGQATPTPPDGPFDAAVVRLPRDREALAMSLHLSAARLVEGAPLYLLGRNDEGIKSAGKRLSPLFSDVQTLDTRRHARLWRGLRTTAPAHATLEPFRSAHVLELPTGPARLVSYPGCFAKGKLDPGTALLLRHLGPALDPAPSTVLDLACGIGVIGAALRPQLPHATLDGCDLDAVAVHATSHNATYDRLGVGDGPRVLTRPSGGWDLIVSNPPLHRGFDEDLSMLHAWIQALPDLLSERGRALLVVQRQRPVRGPVERALGQVDVLADEGGFRVYLCQRR